MSWATLIVALLEAFLPIFAEWIRKWMETRLNAATANLPPVESFGNATEAKLAALDAVIADCRRPLRRALLKAMRRQVAADVVDLDELRDLAAANNDD